MAIIALFDGEYFFRGHSTSFVPILERCAFPDDPKEVPLVRITNELRTIRAIHDSEAGELYRVLAKAGISRQSLGDYMDAGDLETILRMSKPRPLKIRDFLAQQSEAD